MGEWEEGNRDARRRMQLCMCYGTAQDCVYTVYMSVDGGKNKQRAGEGGV